MRSRVSFLLLAGAVALACVTAAATTAAASASHRGSQKVIATRSTRPLRTAIYDPFLFYGLQQVQAFSMLHAAGGSAVRLNVRWYVIAPRTRPGGFVASDPNSAGYSWSSLDANIANAEAAGLTPILDIGNPPSWGYHIQPSGTKAGTPDIKALGEFATAIAKHYDGHHGAPAAHIFQVWNEPNLSLDLSPVNPVSYRNMVNAVAASVHAVDPANLVVAGAMDPFGGKAKRYYKMSPLPFMRQFLCVSKGAHPHSTCRTQVHFDIWAHNPYTFQGPDGHAKQPTDVSIGDLPKMSRLLHAGIKLHHIVSKHPVQFWATEFSWDTNPPRKRAAPPALEARWTAEAFHQMWLSGISLVTWFLLQDHGGTSPFQSGLYFHSKTLQRAKAKPMRTAFSFPFVAYLGKGVVRVWGRDATSSITTVSIQRRHGSKGPWRTVGRIRANRYGIFLANLKLRATAEDWLRATAPDSGRSLSFSLTRPSSTIRYGPWGNP